ncbi:MAG: hydantoinase B/oxoprolinase family protein [Alphaproteobacteria bacterium]|nr:hydantoinase B/oxoprolinase family protein [Alphaproteobacteria bacterium]
MTRAARRRSPAHARPALAPDIDPIRFELIRNAMAFLVNEMALTLVRASYSGILRDNMDFSTGLADPAGEMIGQGLSLPLQFGPMPDAVAAVKARWAGRMEDGDVFVLNDPFEGGTHLPDVFFIKPIFDDGELLCFACVSGHQVDVGGRVAGSNACDSTEVYAEGLRMPPLKLYERGRPNETLFAVIEKNVRVPVKLLGDFRAQVSALRTGEAGVRELVARYGKATVRRYWAELLDHGERMTRAAIRELPRGSWRFEDRLDSDGIVARPVPLRVEVTIGDGTITADWTGSSPQVAGAINSTMSMTKSTTYFAVRSILRGEIPSNGGFFRPIRIIAEKGSILDAEPPAASAGRGVVLFRQADTLFGALAQAVPDRVPAANEGGTTVYGFGGYDDARRPFVLVEVFGSTWGGRPDRDGIDGCAHPLLNQRNIPAELIELEHPLLVRRYGFLENTGGAGRHRGGLSLVREFVYRGTTPCQLQIRADRRTTMPYGLAAGEPGTPSWNILNPGTRHERVLPAMTTLTLAPGDAIRFVTPGGGGWGDPLQRDPAAVAGDVRDGKIDPATARRAYRVVVDGRGALDAAATERLRRGPAAARNGRRGQKRNRRRRIKS